MAMGQNFQKMTLYMDGCPVVSYHLLSKSLHINIYFVFRTELQMKNRQGALAQFTRVPASALVKRPPNITPTEAAGITVACLTSYQALFHIAKLEADQTIFVNGGSSSLGAYAIQMAKAKGAKVIATASGKNEEFVRSLGADEVCSQSY